LSDRSRKRCVTRPGIEGGRNVTGRRRRTALPAEPPAVVRPEATSGCNECNEALEGARNSLASERRFALVAENALVNGDCPRALAALRDLHAVARLAGELSGAA
jgi:hypothetical protein